MLQLESFDNIRIMVDESFVKVPLSCPVCNFLFRDSEDHDSYLEFKCCSACCLQFAWPNKVAWNKGWRPSHEMIIDFRKNRLSVPSYTVRG